MDPMMPDGPDTPDKPDPVVDPNTIIPPPDAEGCHAIYAQDAFPTFELTIHPDVWAQLMWEWNNGQANEDAGVNPHPYHTLTEFKYGKIVIRDAAIRLRGNPTHWEPVPGGDKMQFQIGFHTKNDKGNFLGLKRLVFDAATFNRHMLRDRLSLAFMREVGIPAPCANNARLVVNGEYYGIFTNIEKLDEVFLARVFKDASTGDLWQRQNWELKTNEDTANDTHLRALRNATTVADIEANLEVDSALRVFAAEAIIPNSDGPWAGGLNFFVYDDPVLGKFRLLPWDLDNTFERFNDDPAAPNPNNDPIYPFNPDPFAWEKPERFHGRPWYDIPLDNDPAWFARYIDIIDEILHLGYTPEKMLARIDAYSNQIRDAVYEDMNKPYTNTTYDRRLNDLRTFVQNRYAFVDAWLVCWQNGGTDDGNGFCVPAQ